MLTEPLIEWSEAAGELAGFVGVFLAAGAVGFRYSALRGRLAPTGSAFEAERRVYGDAAKRAAVLGLVGALVMAARTAMALPGAAARAHTTLGGLVTGNLGAGLQVGCLVLALLGFALAAGRVRAGWMLAAVGVIAGTLRGIAQGQWSRMVNPVHELAAGLWIGTLFVLLVCGLAMVLRDEPVRARRGAIVADMVNAFSPLALVCGLVVVVFGLITAWNHLHRIDALWTTPYGWALIAKLVVVAFVFGLGAWNWRRQRPILGSEEGALALRRSARAELIAAGLVLLITAVLVSLPSPRAPGEGAGPEGPPPAGAPAPPPPGQS
ncbi:MAG TPA: CopD family protein [Longimicrobiaceae bacterium]|jgi:putative copper export protein|nr:CopD family protein [Longimicrobiaceae bacterium]